ncbi:MAG: lipoyl(octanoyl) transferase LipB [Bryobacterales bacterium]|jgi:lipoyl(octanoyl) transferase|nr:lipoyl(octanoyl) transferase LipB [Bryobacterales bacterium]
MRKLRVLDLGHLDWREAFRLQETYAEERKQGLESDILLLVEHPHVVTMGRNGNESNLLASPELLRRSGIAFYETNRGGDVTYHGPGQVVGYPIFDLRDWKRDVGAFVRAVEEVLIRSLAAFGVVAERVSGKTGVWVNGAKVAAIGIHLSRWVSSHGFALNHETSLQYFGYIVPCGLPDPVCSLESLGMHVSRDAVCAEIVRHFVDVFEFHAVETIQSPAAPVRCVASEAT